MANHHMVKRGLWDGPVTLKNADLWQWFLSQQINRASGMANHHMVKRGPVGRTGHTKERGPVAMVPVTTNNRTWGQNSYF